MRLVIIDRSQKSQGKIIALNNIDCVPSNVQSLHLEVVLYVFEDNEAVIKMINKGRSPTIRHVSNAEKEERPGRPDVGSDPKTASDYYYHEQFMENFSSASYSKLDDDRASSFQEWKTDTETYERSGRPDKISWKMIRKVRPGFFHEEILLDGTAQSVKNEETPGATRYRYSRKGMASTIRHWKR